MPRGARGQGGPKAEVAPCPQLEEKQLERLLLFLQFPLPDLVDELLLLF